MVKVDTEGYPESLQVLVEGVPAVGAVDKKFKFLRRIPIDPMTNSTDWGLRSYQDDLKSTSWGGQNVFDVYTKSEGTALDGTRYKDW
jgi:general secretion pathway protein G